MNKLAPHQTRIEASHLDEIRVLIDWQAMFAGLGLRKAEAKSKPHDFWAFSPFHDERTPSFHMTCGGLWYDFSIGEGRGPIELVQKIKGGNCYEAGRFILEQGWASASVSLAEPVKSNASSVKQCVKKTVTEAQPQNAPIRQDLLSMCDYHPLIEERGISSETAELLGIGFLPQGRSPLRGRIVFQVADARETAKSKGALKRVILSHLGRALDDETEPKYLFYQGFHKSAELYGQELILLHEEAAEQVAQTGQIVLTEGPFDVAKAVEAGLRNVVGSFGSTLSDLQAVKLAQMAAQFGAKRILVAFDRDKAGQDGAQKAAQKLEDAGLSSVIFDWNACLGKSSKGAVSIPETVRDLCDFSTKQLAWLRANGHI